MSKEKSFVVQPAAPRDHAKLAEMHKSKKRKGLPLPEGFTFQDLSTDQRKAYFNGIESQWKRDYNKRRGTMREMMPSLDISMG